MKILRLILAEFLRGSQIKIEIAGFDMEKFHKALRDECYLDLCEIEDCVWNDEMTDSEKIEAIKECLARE